MNSLNWMWTFIFRSSGPVSFGFQSLEGSGGTVRSVGSPGDYAPIPASSPDSTHSVMSLQNELNPTVCCLDIS